MAKKLKIYERFLLGIALMADTLIDTYQAGMVAYREMRYYDPWGPPGYKPANIYRSLNYLLKTGYIEKVVKNGKPYLRLTSKANEKLKRDFPLFRMQKRKWDKKWRFVIFDISEKAKQRREALRNKLKELGFGMLQRSVYISPYEVLADIHEFLKTHQLLGEVFVLTAKHELMGDPKELARRVWSLDELEEEYVKIWQKIIRLKEAKNKNKAVREIKNDYLELIKKDPCLPFDLLPPDWPAEEVKKAVVSL